MALKGARVALLLGGLTSLIVIPLALFFGMSAGYFGGRIDDAVFFVISTLSSIPSLLLLIALIVALGRGPVQVCFAMGVTGWVGFSRVIRGETLKLRELDYVAAARALGASDARILLRHILPNLLHLVVITFVLLFSGMVLTEAILAFLGIGIDGSWGQMIDQARDELARDPIIVWNIAASFFGAIRADPVGELRRRHDPRHPRPAHGPGERVTEPVLEVSDLVTTFPTETGPGRRGGRHLAAGRRGRGARAGRRVGLRQVGDRALDPAPRAAAGADRVGPRLARGARRARAAGDRDARGARRRGRDDLPGADDEPEPGADGRRAGGRGDPAAREGQRGRARASAASSCSSASASPTPTRASRATRTSSRAGSSSA